MAGRRLQRLPGTRVEPAPNSEYAPVSKMRLIMRDYGMYFVNTFGIICVKHYSQKFLKSKVLLSCSVAL